MVADIGDCRTWTPEQQRVYREMMRLWTRYHGKPEALRRAAQKYPAAIREFALALTTEIETKKPKQTGQPRLFR